MASAMEDLLKEPIIVQTYPPNLAVKPRALQGLMLLPREHLALSYLDLTSPNGQFESSRFYKSNIKILDLESRIGTCPVVLIARLESNKTFYALERQDDGLYTLCKLGSWVNLEAIGQNATVSCSRLVKPRPTLPENTAVLEPPTTPQLQRENKKRRLAIEAIQSLVKKPTRSRSVLLPSQGVESTQASTQGDVAESQAPAQLSSHGDHSASEPATRMASQVIAVPGTPEDLVQPTLDDTLDNVRHQYFEALYHSMGSLAYFAKGALSRARAAFHLDCDSALEMVDLVEFLKSLVMSTVQIDKKYRDAIPDILAKMKIHAVESDNEQGTKATKRKSRKTRLGKNGLYPSEDEHVRKWWGVHKPQPKDEDSMTTAIPQETRLQLSCLRSRETQLQIIIILEVLALESLKSVDNPNDSQLPGLPGEEPTPGVSKELPTKKRNKHNLPMLLDVHADRLSIWQSTALDEINMLEDSQAQRQEADKSARSSSDPLRDFCVDIIVPFFSSRLPEHCDSINRKLGGPVMPSPPKSKPKKPDMTVKPKLKSGGATRKAAPPKSSRTLDRVLSKEIEQNRRSISRGPRGTIALLRSASIPVIPNLKREASEPLSVADIPKGDLKDLDRPKSRPSSSSSLVQSKQRSGEERAKKEAHVKAELQDAILSLRKPNREVVSKALAETDERRATTSLSQLRKSKKPTQHPRFQTTIKATPVGVRFRDALAGDAHNQPNFGIRHRKSTETDHMPSSSSIIPSSAPRKRNRDEASIEESPELPASKRSSGYVAATPAKPSIRLDALSVSGIDDGLVLASSPVLSRKASQSNFLTVPGSSLRHRDSGIEIPSSPPRVSYAETPVKKPSVGGFGSLEGYITVTPVKKRNVDHGTAASLVSDGTQVNEGMMKMSIFERRGWDEDPDDLA
ncbi:DNA replication regulator SLD3-domain-containing protein [Pseudomassariella vexata]|uniref:DNA replication regulator SLD3-domain-containing protein n=1 Tax=Pseudomassariella vexata TaxID=1141098 RepID=A0A1Y2DSF4_9PEZI|nr:DNA replication regulator SLD3-domain-containing protein [Pseudomassariella vexata]ORY62094.1 DNA replication regulator SLD3-domain-containing protein [Pseudomassariella vexata]